MEGKYIFKTKAKNCSYLSKMALFNQCFRSRIFFYIFEQLYFLKLNVFVVMPTVIIIKMDKYFHFLNEDKNYIWT